MIYDKDSIIFQPLPTHFNFKDRTGQTVNKLTFLGIAGRDKKNRILWFIECHCLNIFPAHGTDIITASVTHCGCQKDELKRLASTTHGMRHTPEYSVYNHAKDRCNNPNDKRYEDYGGRGIEFRFNSFEEFFAEVGLRPEDKTKIDRIDVNGHYEVGNVRWVDDIESANNTRANKFWTYQGKTQTHIQWCREFEISHSLLIYRLKAGWDEEKAFTTPAHRGITFQGETHTRAEWSRKLGFGEHVLFNRLKLGWSIEKALTTPVRKSVKRSSLSNES